MPSAGQAGEGHDLEAGAQRRDVTLAPTLAPPHPVLSVKRVPALPWLLLATGLALTGVAVILARTPGAVEEVYARGVGPAVSRALSLATGWVPVSVAGLGLAALLAWGGWRAVRGVAAVRAGRVGAAPAMLGGVTWMAGVAGVLLVAFYLSWGFNYARAPLDRRLALPVPDTVDAGELGELTRTAVTEANRAYRRLHGGADDAGTPTSRPSAAELSRHLRSGWARVAGPLGLPASAGAAYGPVKTRGTSALIRLFGIRGVYAPFTGEAHVDGAIPGIFFGGVAAHEQAHQRGIARENEATFAGVLAAVHADSPYLRYSGWARIAFTLLSDLARVDRQAYEAERARLLPGIERDRRDHVRWLRSTRAPAAPVARRVNDAYLRAHGVPGGVANYGRVAELLVAWSRRHGLAPG